MERKEKSMSKKWKVVKHGTNYVEVSSPIICPECGDLIEKVDRIENLSSEWFFFDSFKRHWSEEHCVCSNCNCKISRKINKRLQVDWSDLLSLIIFSSLFISIIGLCVFIPLFCIKKELIFLILLCISAGVCIINLLLIAIMRWE